MQTQTQATIHAVQAFCFNKNGTDLNGSKYTRILFRQVVYCYPLDLYAECIRYEFRLGSWPTSLIEDYSQFSSLCDRNCGNGTLHNDPKSPSIFIQLNHPYSLQCFALHEIHSRETCLSRHKESLTLHSRTPRMGPIGCPETSAKMTTTCCVTTQKIAVLE